MHKHMNTYAQSTHVEHALAHIHLGDGGPDGSWVDRPTVHTGPVPPQPRDKQHCPRYIAALSKPEGVDIRFRTVLGRCAVAYGHAQPLRAAPGIVRQTEDEPTLCYRGCLSWTSGCDQTEHNF